MTATERARGALLGLACGDAVGTTVEFKPRGSFTPLTDMVGGGPFKLSVGAWTDDTSMALCLAESLVECGGFEAKDQMEQYVRWYREGHWSSTGRCFDIGNTVRDALGRFILEGIPFAGSIDPRAAGNGCLMRLAPVPIYFRRDAGEAVKWSRESARTTHGAAECIEATELFARMLLTAMSGAAKEDVLFGHVAGLFKCPKVKAIAAGEYRAKPEAAIRGSGYVIDCLEASAWCLLKTVDFREAVLRAANLGDDADTTAAVVGQLAGAYYGEAAVPEDWRDKLARRNEIETLLLRLVC